MRCVSLSSTGKREEEHRIVFGGTLLENHKPLSEYGIESGDLHLLPLGYESAGIAVGTPESWRLDSPRLQYTCLAAATATAVTNNQGVVDAIRVISNEKPRHPDITFKSIRLSCASHVFSGEESRYAGFILYAWEDEEGVVKDEWWLNGRHCKSAYFVIQGTDSPDVKRYTGKAPGQVHGAVIDNRPRGTGLETDHVFSFTCVHLPRHHQCCLVFRTLFLAVPCQLL